MKNIAIMMSCALIGMSVGLEALNAKEPSIGKKAPDFSATDIDGKVFKLSENKGKFVVLEWTNPDCPFVRKHYDSMNMQELQKEYTAKGAVWFSICSSAEGKQGYYPAADWKKIVQERKIESSAILLDPAGAVGKLYGAKTTPHLFVINPDRVLIYKGAIDDKPSTDVSDVQIAKNYVRMSLEEAIAGKKVSVPATSSYGCSVKYK